MVSPFLPKRGNNNEEGSPRKIYFLAKNLAGRIKLQRDHNSAKTLQAATAQPNVDRLRSFLGIFLFRNSSSLPSDQLFLSFFIRLICSRCITLPGNKDSNNASVFQELSFSISIKKYLKINEAIDKLIHKWTN